MLMRSYFKKYEEMCREAVKYHRSNLQPPRAFQQEYRLVLDMLRAHMNEQGYPMPTKLAA